jgi:RHS repeat-associated protein
LNQLNVRVGAYRYGFNGKENDNEVKGVGDQQDYGNRIYDPRVGRFLSTDPITNKYPELTPYQFASNTPIWGIDQDGLELAKLWGTIDQTMTMTTLLFEGPNAAAKVHQDNENAAQNVKNAVHLIKNAPAQATQTAKDVVSNVKAAVNNYNKASTPKKLQAWGNAVQSAALNVSVMALTDGAMDYIGANYLNLDPNIGYNVPTQSTGAPKETGIVDPPPSNSNNFEGSSSISPKLQEPDLVYENPGTHDPTKPNFNNTKSVLPENAESLFEKSIPDPENSTSKVQVRWTKAGNGGKAVYHRFQNSGGDTPYHWNGSTNSTLKNGTPYPIKETSIPVEVKRMKGT